jgi:hypothetical protein
MMAVLISPLMLAACAPAEPDAGTAYPSDYRGVETSLLDGDLVQFHVAMGNPRAAGDLDAYAECAAAQYALIRGYGFARHLRTNINEEGGVWTADAVYTISPSLPRGKRTIDAEVVVANCVENGIPTV